MNSRFLFLSIAVLILAHSFSLGQKVMVSGKFMKDSIAIGNPIPFSLSVKYPSDLDMLFPDSTFKFTPFEFEKKVYFPTKTLRGISTDSVLYFLSTYEIDSVQKLRLPAFIHHKADCTVYWTETDSVNLIHTVEFVPDSVAAQQLPLKVNAYYEPVQWLFNYPLASIIGGVVLIAAIVFFIVFGKRIRQYFLTRRLKRNFENFIRSFGESLSDLKSNYSGPKAEGTLALWKKYMEILETKPYTKLTSKEIHKIASDEALGSALQIIDKSIYGNWPPHSFDPFYQLKSYSEDRYYKKLEEIRAK